MKSLIIKIYGRVQGVGYRYFAQRQARKLGITGYIENKNDGSVYIEAYGSEENLKEFIELLKEGPPLAIVEKVIVEENLEVRDFKDFDIKL